MNWTLSILPMLAGAMLATYLLLSVSLAPANERGVRGLARETSRRSSLFRWLDPVVRLLASHVRSLPIAKLRRDLDARIIAAGEYHGFGPDELIAATVLTTLAGAGAAHFVSEAVGGALLPLLCLGIGPLFPFMQLSSKTKERHKSVERGLPAAIDLAALCMGAGLDFPGALRHVVDNMPDRTSPIRQELERILQELSLGRTRKEALESFAARVDVESVREFVASVVQAEQKGTPLSTVLSVQATALRGRRSVLAEEAAARAGVMLMLPMLLMMMSIGLILMGPLIIDMMNGGLM